MSTIPGLEAELVESGISLDDLLVGVRSHSLRQQIERQFGHLLPLRIIRPHGADAAEFLPARPAESGLLAKARACFRPLATWRSSPSPLSILHRPFFSRSDVAAGTIAEAAGESISGGEAPCQCERCTLERGEP